MIAFSHLFQRALRKAFSWQPLLFLSLVLSVCGVLIVFCRGLESVTGIWGISWIPLFLSAGIILAAGVVVIRSYLRAEGRPFYKILFSSWDTILSSAYLGLPLLLAFLILWILLGVFVLLKEIPYLGTFFGVILAFAPFLVIFMMIALLALTLFLLFFATPAIALTEVLHLKSIAQRIVHPFRRDFFSHLFLWFLALVPVAVSVALLWWTQSLTEEVYSLEEGSFENLLQWYFMMLPFAVLLSPAVLFYFNFAAEVYRENAIPPSEQK